MPKDDYYDINEKNKKQGSKNANITDIFLIN